jgi:hypothetical protein
VELSLSLYRDHALLKYILDSAKVPDGVERVALSLADSERGPFLVVTRDGKFVTCLGEGMSKGALMVIPREKVDSIATRLEVLRGRIEVAKKVTGERGGVGRLFRRLYEAGPRLSREEFIAAAAWQPMLAMHLVRWMIDTAEDVAATKIILARQLRRTDKLNPKFADSARSYYNSLWFIGHVSTLAALDGTLPFENLPAKTYNIMQQLPFAWSSVRQGLIGPALRGIWGSGRMGPMLLRRYKELRREATTIYRVIETTYSLAAIGLRHSHLEAEVENELALPLAPSVGGEIYQKGLDLIAKEVYQVYKATLDDRDVMLPLHLGFGGDLAVQLSGNAKPGSRFKYAQITDVPSDLAYALPMNTPQEFAGEWKNFHYLSYALPWLATAEAEQFYLPAAYLSEVIRPYEAEEIMPLLLGLREQERDAPGQTRSTPKGSARNEPCPCGSGAKYKRCCFGKSEIVPVGDEEPENVEPENVEPENELPAHSNAIADEWGKRGT